MYGGISIAVLGAAECDMQYEQRYVCFLIIISFEIVCFEICPVTSSYFIYKSLRFM
jgi:hypothetical protein